MAANDLRQWTVYATTRMRLVALEEGDRFGPFAVFMESQEEPVTCNLSRGNAVDFVRVWGEMDAREAAIIVREALATWEVQKAQRRWSHRFAKG